LKGGLSAEDLMTNFQYQSLNISKEDVLSSDMKKLSEEMTILPGEVKKK
jgi:predicted component of type VI protein secretion system